ncbi:MAG: O-antigen polymerase [Candidatus Acidiferrales bacterium]
MARVESAEFENNTPAPFGSVSRASGIGNAGKVFWPLTFVLTYIFAVLNASNSIAVLSCIVVGVSYALTKKHCRPFAVYRITITSFWYVTYLAMIFLPSFFIFAGQEGPYRSMYLFGVESVLITVPFGWYLADSYFHFRQQEVDGYFVHAIEQIDSTPRMALRFALFLAIAILLMVAYLVEVPTVPLFYLLRNPGNLWQLVLLREESLKLLNSPLRYFYAVARGTLYPFLIVVSMGCYLQSRRRAWLILFGFSLATGVFYASLTLAKAPVAAIILLMVLMGYIYSGGHLARKIIVGGLLLTFAFPTFVVVSAASAQEDVGPGQALIAISGRLLEIPAEVVYYYFEVFPSHVPYLHGRSIDKFARLTGQQPFDTANYVGLYALPAAVESITYNGAFIADLYADFGIAGVLIGGVLAGAIMQMFHIFLVRSRKTIPNIASYAFLILAFWYMNSTSLPEILASDGALLVLALKWYLERGRISASDGGTIPALSA